MNSHKKSVLHIGFFLCQKTVGGMIATKAQKNREDIAHKGYIIYNSYAAN